VSHTTSKEIACGAAFRLQNKTASYGSVELFGTAYASVDEV